MSVQLRSLLRHSVVSIGIDIFTAQAIVIAITIIDTSSTAVADTVNEQHAACCCDSVVEHVVVECAIDVTVTLYCAIVVSHSSTGDRVWTNGSGHDV